MSFFKLIAKLGSASSEVEVGSLVRAVVLARQDFPFWEHRHIGNGKEKEEMVDGRRRRGRGGKRTHSAFCPT